MNSSGMMPAAASRVTGTWRSAWRTRRRKWDKVALLFIAPWLLHLLVFTLYPLMVALYGSVADWNILTDEMHYVGAQYYVQLLHDPLFAKAVGNSFVYLICQVPLAIVGGLFAALLLNQPKLLGRLLFRGIYFLPFIVPSVVAAIIWQWMYATDTGVFNLVLEWLGLQPIPWLTSETYSMPSIALMKIWGDIGLYAVIFLAALQGLPPELLDAASVDGANAWQSLWYIKLPLLNPIVTFAIVMGTLWGLNIFTEPLLMTNGGPLGSSLTTLLYLYQQGFTWSRLGYANAIGVVSTIMILILTLAQRKLLERVNA